MPKPNHSDRRREPRYDVSNFEAIPVQIKRKKEDQTETIDGQLLTLSRSGAKVSISACLQFAEEVILEITIAPLDIHMQMDARVCWIRASDSHQWLIGCSFAPALSDEAIGRLAVSGIIERRQYARRPVDVGAKAKWQLEEEWFPVAIRQYSFGGFCLACQEAPQVDQGVRISITTSDNETYVISGRIRWHLEQNGEHVVGCTFSASEDFPHLLEAAEKMRGGKQKGPHGAAKPLRRHRLWPQPATTMLLVIGSASIAGSISYWTTTRPPDARIASLEQNASFGDPDSRPVPSATAHEDLRNETRPGLADRSSRPPVGHDRTASDEQPQPEEWSDEVASDGSAPRPSEEIAAARTAPGPTDEIPASGRAPRPSEEVADSRSEPTPTDSMATSITPSIPEASSGAPTLPVENGITTNAVPADSAQDEQIDSRPLIDFISGMGEGLREQVDIPVIEIPLAEPTPSARDRQTSRSEEAAWAPTPAEVRQAREAFVRGTQFYGRGDYPKAIDEFRVAAKNEPQNPLYYYVMAMSLYQENDLQQAKQNVHIAIALERDKPIKNWGSVLAQYQGKPRLWVEQRRSAVKLGTGG